MKKTMTPVAVAAVLACANLAAQAQAQAQAQATPDAPAATPAAGDKLPTLNTVVVRASADASAAGLSPAYPGGQVARGGRAGILGTRDALDTPLSITSYTNQFIQDRQARSVGDVLQADPTVRTARGFGNFQESYFIRGFILNSDDVAYNGLYSLLPRQYIATELFERVEVLRGASAFLSGAAPGGSGVGGAINLLPKRAPNEALTQVTAGVASGGQATLSTDVARRFGPDGATGVRVNAALRNGGTAVDDERARLGLLAVGVDWRSRDVRLSGDLGWQDNRLKRTRPSVSLGAVAQVPAVPDASANFAQPWTYSNERDLFGTLRGEWDIAPDVTAWAAYGLRRSKEANSVANPTVGDAATGASSANRFDNTRKDQVDTGEVGLRGKLRTGAVGHEWVASAARFELRSRAAYGYSLAALPSGIYSPVAQPRPDFSAAELQGDFAHPGLTLRTRLTSVALGDTLSLAGDRLLLILGARHQQLDIANYAYGSGAQTSRDDRSRTSPMAGVVLKASQALSLYANYVEGLSQGETAPTFVTPPPANAGQTLPTYVSRQKEVGLKYDGGRVGGGVALFSTNKPRAYVDAANVFTAAGQDRHRGVELTAFGRPVKALRVLGGLTWLDAEQRRTGSAATDGKDVIGVPRWQANLGAEWDVPGVSGLALDARVVHTGARWADAANTLQVPGWTRLDLGARYLTEWDGRLVTLRARVDNATDRAHWASVGGYPGFGYLTAGAPRSVSLSASIEF